MPSVTRRGFIKSTSLSFAAIGALGVLPGLVNASPASSQSQDQPHTGPAPMPVMPMLAGGAPFVVYVSDPSTGTGTIMVGERSIPFTNGAVVQSLRQAIG
jgi:hypothetical protein